MTDDHKLGSLKQQTKLPDNPGTRRPPEQSESGETVFYALYSGPALGFSHGGKRLS